MCSRLRITQDEHLSPRVIFSVEGAIDDPLQDTRIQEIEEYFCRLSRNQYQMRRGLYDHIADNFRTGIGLNSN